MNNNRLTASKSKAALEEQSYDLIQQHIIDPENKNHLLPDPETAHVVRQIFAMYIRGDRICEIQDWLRENKVLTVGAADKLVASPTYGMADFSSWGATTELTLKPEITAPGAGIYAAVPGNAYESMDGTSMASPMRQALWPSCSRP